jgi:hypothetical protein
VNRENKVCQTLQQREEEKGQAAMEQLIEPQRQQIFLCTPALLHSFEFAPLILLSI